MSWLSLYGITYNQAGNEQIKLWRGWTNEQKAYVVKQAYEKYYINSEDIKSYLTYSRLNTISNLLFPVATFYIYHNFIHKTFFRRSFNKTAGGFATSALVTLGASLLWINLSPIYQQKSQLRIDLLQKIVTKLGNSTIQLNDILPRTWTQSEIDRQARSIYHQRNSEDNLRPMVQETKGRKYSRRWLK